MSRRSALQDHIVAGTIMTMKDTFLTQVRDHSMHATQHACNHACKHRQACAPLGCLCTSHWLACLSTLPATRRSAVQILQPIYDASPLSA